MLGDHSPALNIFALTTRGLEAVSAAEIASLPGAAVIETGYRRVTAQYHGSVALLLALRTVDDLYLDVATWNDLRHTRDMLPTFQEWSAKLDLTSAAKVCETVRPIRSQPLFSVTASFVGKRNYSADEIKLATSQGITSGYGWMYTPDDRVADFNLRIFIEHDTAYVGIRLSQSPLHERGYKRSQQPGSLKPPVAAAMLRLAEIRPGHRLLDPCCGAGTILIEGAGIGAVAIGGDIELDAVIAVRTNAAAAGFAVKVEQWDARSMPLPAESIDRIVTNLPWGRQIVVDDELGAFYRVVCGEIERVLAPGGRVVILSGTPRLLQFEGLRAEPPLEISLFGQTPTIAQYAATR